MAQKRTSAEADIQPIRTLRTFAKRNRLSPLPATAAAATTASRTNSSERSSAATSSTSSVLASTSRSSSTSLNRESGTATSLKRGKSRLGTQGSQSADDLAASDAISSDDDDLAPRNHPTISLSRTSKAGGVAEKPEIDPELVMTYAAQLRTRLQKFIPQLQKANSDMASHAAQLNIEDVGDNEAHIEMNLGLGVLEHQTEPSQPPIQESKSQRREGKPKAHKSVTGANVDVDAMAELLNVQRERGDVEIDAMKAVQEVRDLPHRTEATNHATDAK